MQPEIQFFEAVRWCLGHISEWASSPLAYYKVYPNPQIPLCIVTEDNVHHLIIIDQELEYGVSIIRTINGLDPAKLFHRVPVKWYIATSNASYSDIFEAHNINTLNIKKLTFSEH